ncbi:PREDICTED: metacaspase-8-like [Camelina sativa]|uniref:Metacaspase-8-like n=1 Tax=Camelina sativa TaxID=90675 RepID=A0ABM0WVG6_CAMSA|nr:PREDICTED: metacaspase-8-like [Camelina sativa]
MAKKALLIGINYPGTAVELRGCVNDVRRMKKCLIERYGFANKDITVLIDTDKSCIQPTGKNIRHHLEELIDFGKSGDFLVFHYSGHGTRLPPPDIESGDSTGFDECITPSDMNLIRDDEFRSMVAKVKKGCQLTIISDSCHSGGLIEEVKEQIGESHVKPIEENHEDPPKHGIVDYLLSILTSFFAICGVSKSQTTDRGGGQESFAGQLELETDETFDVKTRYIPFHIYVSLLKQKTGKTNIQSGRIRQTLAKLFGEDSSMSRDRSVREIGNCEVNAAVDSEGTKPKTKVFADNGILLSGCQTNEKSEDVYVTRTGKAYGAFSDAIQTILSETRKDKKITNKKLVMRAREILKRHRFSQRPGLYCHDRYVNKPFIC